MLCSALQFVTAAVASKPAHSNMTGVATVVVHRRLRKAYPCQHACVDCGDVLVCVKLCDHTSEAGITNKLALHLKVEAARSNNQQAGQERQAVSQ